MEAAPAPEDVPPGAVAVVVSMRTVYATTGVLLLVAVLGGLALYRQIWGRTGGETGWDFWVLLVAGVVVHEGLHGLAMVSCGVPPGELRFGVQPSRGVAFATTRRPMAVGHYRFVLVLPLLVLGLVPFVAGLALGDALVAKLGSLMVLGAGGDVAVLLALRSLPSGVRVVDHPSQPGCYVLPA
jgi:hypothetical protein